MANETTIPVPYRFEPLSDAPLANSSDIHDDQNNQSLNDTLAAKQGTLVSGQNIKTVNNQSLLGAGNITIQGGGGGDVTTEQMNTAINTATEITATEAVNDMTPSTYSAGDIFYIEGNDTKRYYIAPTDGSVAADVTDPTKFPFTDSSAEAIRISLSIKDIANLNSQKGAASGIASLDSSAKIPVNQIPNDIKNGAQAGATAYQKPQTGIPATDLAQTVQDKIDNSVQLESGKVPANVLPSYVDDIIEGYKDSSSTTEVEIFGEFTAYSKGDIVKYQGHIYRFTKNHAAGDFNMREVEEITQFPNDGETGKIYSDVLTNKTWRWSGVQYTQIKGDLALGETQGTAFEGSKGRNLELKSVRGDVVQSLTDDEKVQAQNNIGGKVYSSTVSNHSGLGKVYLEKGNGVLTQSMVNTANTVYVIQYDYTLDSNIRILDGCVLEFDGGSISGGGTNKDTITASYVLLNDWKFNNIKFSDGSSFDFTCPINVPVNGAKEFCETILSYKSNTSTKPTIFIFGSTNPYTWNGVLNINKKYVTLTGGGVIQGTIHLGYTASDYEELHYGSYPTTAHHCIYVDNLRFNKYNFIGTDSNDTTIENFIKNGDVTNTNHIAISLINVNHVKISNCFFDNVPYPIVYTPNSTYVNQNVRRLIIDNCDFERCKIGVYAPTNVNDPYEYGDLIVINSYFYPHRASIVAYDIDGFKCYNNVMNTSTINTAQGVNMELHKCSQIVITGNSFYGEYNKYGLLLKDCGNTNINGNTFCVQRSNDFAEEVSDGACIDFSIHSDSAIPGVSICNNLFSGCEIIPIFIRPSSPSGGRICNLTIQGNTVSGDTFSISSKIVYCITAETTNRNLQSNYYPEITHSSIFLDIKLKALDMLRNVNDIRGNVIKYINEQIFNTVDSNLSYRIRSITKTKPIVALRFNDSAKVDYSKYGVYVRLLFNGTIVKIPKTLFTESGATKLSVLTGIKDIIDRNFTDSFDTTIISDTLWIKGKSDGQIMPSMCIDTVNYHHPAIIVDYQNLGYNITLYDTDKKNHIFLDDNNFCYCGIDANDNNKLVILKDKVVTLKTTQSEDRYESLYFREGSADTYKFLLDDAFFVRHSSEGSATTILADIVNFCYSDRFSITGTTITALTKNIEYGFEGNWPATRDYHVVDYQFLTPEGRVYNPITDTYSGITDGNLVSVDSNGKLVDSGKKPSDFEPA